MLRIQTETAPCGHVNWTVDKAHVFIQTIWFCQSTTAQFVQCPRPRPSTKTICWKSLDIPAFAKLTQNTPQTLIYTWVPNYSTVCWKSLDILHLQSWHKITPEKRIYIWMPMCASEFIYISSGGSKYELACKGGIVQRACLVWNSTPLVQHSCGTAKLFCAVLYVSPLHGGRNCSFAS